MTPDFNSSIPHISPVAEDGLGNSAHAVADPPTPAAAAGRATPPAPDPRLVSACAVLLEWLLEAADDPAREVMALVVDGSCTATAQGA